MPRFWPVRSVPTTTGPVLRMVLSPSISANAGRLAGGLPSWEPTGSVRSTRTIGWSKPTALAHVTIGLVDDGDLEACQAPITLLEPSLSRLVDLWDIAKARSARTGEAQRLTLVPNVLCVAGAFFLGFTSLAAVIVSNLGTFGSFSVAAEQLRRSHRTGRDMAPTAFKRLSRVP